MIIEVHQLWLVGFLAKHCGASERCHACGKGTVDGVATVTSWLRDADMDVPDGDAFWRRTATNIKNSHNLLKISDVRTIGAKYHPAANA